MRFQLSVCGYICWNVLIVGVFCLLYTYTRENAENSLHSKVIDIHLLNDYFQSMKTCDQYPFNGTIIYSDVWYDDKHINKTCPEPYSYYLYAPDTEWCFYSKIFNGEWERVLSIKRCIEIFDKTKYTRAENLDDINYPLYQFMIIFIFIVLELSIGIILPIFIYLTSYQKESDTEYSNEIDERKESLLTEENLKRLNKTDNEMNVFNIS